MPTPLNPRFAGGVGEALPHATQPPQQMELPTIPLPPFAPRWPSPRALEHTALELFLSGEYVTAEQFRQLTDSTELRVFVLRLIRLGWPIKRHIVPSPVRRNRNRHAGVWFLPKNISSKRKPSPPGRKRPYERNRQRQNPKRPAQPDPSMGEDDWWQIAAALRSEGEHLFDAFDQWSAGGKNYKGTQDSRAKWNAHPPKPGGKTTFTLYGMAMEGGWKQSKATKASHTTQTKPAPTPAPAPTEAPKPTNPVYDLLNIRERSTPATAQHAYCIAKQVSDGPALEGLRVLPNNDPMQLTAKDESATAWPVLYWCPFACPMELCRPGSALPKLAPRRMKFAQVRQVQSCEVQTGKRVSPYRPNSGRPSRCILWRVSARHGPPFQATGHASVVTFGVGRTKTVASAIQQHRPEARIVLVLDVGQEAQAQKVAKELGCAVVTMPGDWEGNADAWDYLQAHGPKP